MGIASVPRVGRGRVVRVLRAGITTPERLRRVAVGLVVGCLLTAVVSMLSGAVRTDAVSESGTRIAALAADAAQLGDRRRDGASRAEEILSPSIGRS